MANKNLTNAKRAKNDEFYTQYGDIQKEIEAYLEYNPKVFRGKVVYCNCDDPFESNFFRYFVLNFNRLGLKQLITTSYKPSPVANTQLGLFGDDVTLTKSKGLSAGRHGRPKINANKFIINEVKDIDGDGEFNLKDIAKQLKANKHNEWTPLNGMGRWISGFIVPKSYDLYGTEARIDENGDRIVATNNCLWLTNLDHGRRHQPLPLMTMEENLKYSKHKEIKGKKAYDKYDNYDAIEVPFTDSIPSNCKGVMGVPITFLDKYNPDQFDILGATQRGCHDEIPDIKKYDDYWEVRQDGKKTGSSGGKTNENANLVGNDGKKNYFINKDGRIIQSAYQRIFIRYKKK